MQTTIENTDKHTVKLTVEVPADEYSKDMDQAYRSIANQVKIPGFRKGKVPRPASNASRPMWTNCSPRWTSSRRPA